MATFISLTACSAELGDREFEFDLAYLDGESNWGPTDATGVAFIDATSGLVEIDVEGLPRLEGEVYEGWVAGGLESPVATGRFNVDDDGFGSSRLILGDLSMDRFTKVVLTVEPDPDPDPGPDPRHSIAGDIPK
ncbi:MAG: hypothetical protein AAGN82_13355 [Myxococcota bacterium]